MFTKDVYVSRRKKLIAAMRQAGERGVLLLVGNIETPVQASTESNGVDFNQDSHFLYYIGLNAPRLAAVIDIEDGETCVYGDDATLTDLVWTGPQPTLRKQAEQVGIARSGRYYEFSEAVQTALSLGRPVHFLRPSDTITC